MKTLKGKTDKLSFAKGNDSYLENKISNHYAQGCLAENILRALQTVVGTSETITQADLAPVDDFILVVEKLRPIL
jgi:hypothetical protein